MTTTTMGTATVTDGGRGASSAYRSGIASAMMLGPAAIATYCLPSKV
jgi:hypothetical protein